MAIKDHWKPILGVVIAAIIIITIVFPFVFVFNTNSDVATGGGTTKTRDNGKYL